MRKLLILNIFFSTFLFSQVSGEFDANFQAESNNSSYVDFDEDDRYSSEEELKKVREEKIKERDEENFKNINLSFNSNLKLNFDNKMKFGLRLKAKDVLVKNLNFIEFDREDTRMYFDTNLFENEKIALKTKFDYTLDNNLKIAPKLIYKNNNLQIETDLQYTSNNFNPKRIETNFKAEQKVNDVIFEIENSFAYNFRENTLKDYEFEPLIFNSEDPEKEYEIKLRVLLLKFANIERYIYSRGIRYGSAYGFPDPPYVLNYDEYLYDKRKTTDEVITEFDNKYIKIDYGSTKYSYNGNETEEKRIEKENAQKYILRKVQEKNKKINSFFKNFEFYENNNMNGNYSNIGEDYNQIMMFLNSYYRNSIKFNVLGSEDPVLNDSLLLGERFKNTIDTLLLHKPKLAEERTCSSGHYGSRYIDPKCLELAKKEKEDIRYLRARVYRREFLYQYTLFPEFSTIDRLIASKLYIDPKDGDKMNIYKSSLFENLGFKATYVGVKDLKLVFNPKLEWQYNKVQAYLKHVDEENEELVTSKYQTMVSPILNLELDYTNKIGFNSKFNYRANIFNVDTINAINETRNDSLIFHKLSFENRLKYDIDTKKVKITPILDLNLYYSYDPFMRKKGFCDLWNVGACFEDAWAWEVSKGNTDVYSFYSEWDREMKKNPKEFVKEINGMAKTKYIEDLKIGINPGINLELKLSDNVKLNTNILFKFSMTNTKGFLYKYNVTEPVLTHEAEALELEGRVEFDFNKFRFDTPNFKTNVSLNVSW